jgi:dTDP-4-amino-4,6-dideoxygalactose transaminase
MSEAKQIIPLCEPSIGEAEQEAMTQCLRSGFVSSVGPLITDFENDFARYVGSKYAVATASGTAAIHTALKTLGIDNESLVGVSDLTFVASVNPIIYCGAEPLLCDSEKVSWGMDPNVLEALAENMLAQGKKISAIIPVHLFGRSCKMDKILDIARRFDIPIVEDATESLGTSLQGRHTGTWGDMGCFSFNGNKLITTGAGGMLVTDSQPLAERARHLVNQARADKQRFFHSEAGFNYRMSNVAAALGLAQLGQIDAFIGRKKEIASTYNSAFRDIPELSLPIEVEAEDSCFWLYSILTESHSLREKLLASLQDNGIQARRFFEPMHQQPYLKKGVWSLDGMDLACRDRGVADDISSRGINLPCSVSLSPDQQARIIELVRLATQSREACQEDTHEQLAEVVAM